MDEKYFARKIEQKWQRKWAENGAFNAEIDNEKPKFYALEMLPYPSGNLHMGHVRNYSAGDALAWFKRLKGFNVLHPFGWDSFGQPAEDAAVKRGVNPREWTEDNIIAMRGQMERMGFSYDWRRQMYAHRPEYYKFDQWFFLKMYEMGLAYKRMTQVNWCSHDQATLSNEQASGGICWRCGNPVTKKDLEQWFLKTTAYTDELLDDMAEIERGWPQNVIKRQQDWIGRSEGAYVEFKVLGPAFTRPGADGQITDTIKEKPPQGGTQNIRIFTTRIDTIYGANAVVVAAGHPLIQEYLESFPENVVGKIVDIRVESAKPADHEVEIEKDGIDTGLKAINPFSGEELPVWVGNYVMMEYGTGAVMSVPAHDERDFEFATKFGLQIRRVISKTAEVQLLRTAYNEEVELFENPKLSTREQEIHEETFAYLQENSEALIDKYYATHGKQIINADRSKELFDAYNDDRLHNDRAVQPSASALTRLILQRRLKELPAGSTVVLTAGGQASGKSTAIRENMDADLIYDSVMASVDGNRRVIDLICERGHFGKIVYVYRQIGPAFLAMLRRRIVEGRAVSEDNMASGHFGSQQAFIKDTDEYARSRGFAVEYVETDENIERVGSKTISLNKLKEKAYISREEALQKIRESYGKIDRTNVDQEFGSLVGERQTTDIEEADDSRRIRGLGREDTRASDSKHVVGGSTKRDARARRSDLGMAVEDERDRQVPVAFTDYGFLINSGEWSGKSSHDAKTEMAAYAADHRFGEAATTYRLRDWGISRQRFWGSPIPIVYCATCGVVPEKFENLPIRLPDDIPITGTGESPLAKIADFVETRCPKCGGPARRETDTMDTFVDSSWYFFRYLDPSNDEMPFDPETAAYWTPVDQYIGGDDHAVMHLIYARFWTKVMRDIGLVKFDEPFKRLLTQGMVVGETFFDDSTGKKVYHMPATVSVTRDAKGKIIAAASADGKPLKYGIERMSKSKGNGVDPDEMVEIYGADAARLFILFAAPIENELVWNEAGIEGAVRFLQRVWRLVYKWKDAVRVTPLGVKPAGEETAKAVTLTARNLRRKTHQTIKRVADNFDDLQFNTPVAALMELSNAIGDFAVEPNAASEDEIAAVREAIMSLTLMLTPYAPHTSEELFAVLIGNDNGILANGARFPEYREELAKADEIEIPVQINGKLRSRLLASPAASNEDLEKMAFADDKVCEYTDGKEIVKVIVVPKRLVNIVVR